ncbi:Octaprenyl diphosphate synthase / Dimethylallyltransferase / (2E,6E)-farnesyl diphosphate synthase / Geranylgeranyl pyrophosphate synthetase [Bathymodiolus heckerae thiotrophic gill symbiont]|uniref:polyprenyl synthetase family protein n=1 Tax=Bathymodiolus heckerae thiotrophic gill symbiont TaxID=1052212 RepID=UPI0010AFB15C|nr:farnesyl diphosphate synthase [Bathymodiolus heckerae thiotrophic gill symbiont]SMN12848.1 Octaprenyl diphosphate synthase / Dimethylallyltransferase / (2E,6E)-farnesyl diphosphate synthase / Geranylgeranyl pyrophosphate synthetase [Bathymodiolus heckerae thiotrophic gill symbiont]
MNYVQRVDQCLDRVLSNQGSLTEAMRYSVLSNGKRFRPILTYTVANTFGANLDLADSSACAVELIHAYSLIHDDLPAMDDDDIRHNQPACHKRFGEAQAILAGDGLQALAFEVLASDVQLSTKIRIDLLQTLTHAAFEMAEGQSIDLSVAAQTVGIDILQNMHQKKTGALLGCAIKLGALVADTCNEKELQILGRFAANIGLAYQIQDDVLDVLTPEEILGKKQNSDADKNKPTYPTLLGLEVSKIKYENLYQRAFSDLDTLDVDIVQLKALTVKLQSRKF